MTVTQRGIHRISLIMLLLAVWSAALPVAAAVEAGEEEQARSQTVAARIGIGGVYRPGHWTGVRPPQDADLSGPICGVETLDSDGVRVRYQQPAVESPAAPTERMPWTYIVAGAAAAPLHFYGEHNDLLWQGRLTGKALAPATPWIVAIGDTLGLETIGQSALLGRESGVAVVQIEAAADLPDQSVGWDGVDLLVINPSGAAIVNQLDERQAAALVDWVTEGGRLLLSLGKDGAAMLAPSPWLSELAGLTLANETLQIDPAALETYTSSQTPLPPLDAYPLPEQGGRTLIAGRTTSRQPTRVVIERLVGLGRVMITAFAPDSAAMSQWPQRTTLISRLHPGLLDIETHRRRDSRATAAVAYDDLAGQVRSALDRFESHRRIPFSIVSLILLAVAALVGPLDYWLINRVVGKPLLGWLSFPLSMLLVSAGLLLLNQRSGAAAVDAESSALSSNRGLRSNQIEVIDINAVSDRAVGRGLSLIHIASPAAARVDLNVAVSPVLSVQTPVQEAAATAAPSPQSLTGPYGYPGATFGGISIAGENRSLPTYTIDLNRKAASFFHRGEGALAGGPVGFPIAPAGSKGWMSRWAFLPTLSDTSGLSQRRGSELLTGSVANPLGTDLFNGVLVYGNWAYLLPTRFRAGQRIEAIDALRQKNFRWHLSRREALENSSRMDTWDVQMHDDLERLAHVLMFETAIGGRDYTGLSNAPLSGLDLSYVLAHGHAVLYGRLAQPVLQTDLPEEKPHVSIVRIILPVAAAGATAR